MYEFEDEISERLLTPFTCVKCGNIYPSYDKDRSAEDTCKYCTGKLIDPCKGCAGEDCVCCIKNPNSNY
ncbi:hypothetical protein LCGC14_2496520 [marine sediment metagenome]|uniref:Uncharacterized protein n=1 Tax=marine sediment metagenome TaxID=412755 RepID=A0A0F9BR51_9ZZZZ